jgi:hypothetical protein
MLNVRIGEKRPIEGQRENKSTWKRPKGDQVSLETTLSLMLCISIREDKIVYRLTNCKQKRNQPCI